MKIRRRQRDEEKSVLDAARSILAAQRAARETARLLALQRRAATVAKRAVPDWRLITGDCVQKLAELPEGCARLVFADPPYNIGVDYGNGRKADALASQQYVEWCERWLEQCHRVLADDGALFLLTAARWQVEMEMILNGSTGNPTMYRRNVIAWHETFGSYQEHNFTECWRPVIYYTKHKTRRVWNADPIRIPSDRQAKYGDRRANPAGKVPTNVWTIPRVTGTSAERMPGVPTQLPLALLTRIVAVASDPGDMVIDPFNGSGTTGAAALKLGRRYTGIEQNPKYVELSRLRLNAVAGEILGGD